MTGFVANFLKAGLIGLLCAPLALWAADSTQVKAEGTDGCTAGQSWDVIVGGCTAPIKLRSVPTSRVSNCSCGEGKTGSCTASQNGSYDVFGWRLSTDGREQISSSNPVTWGPVHVITSSCKAEGN
jgi:hypothetical protein